MKALIDRLMAKLRGEPTAAAISGWERVDQQALLLKAMGELHAANERIDKMQAVIDKLAGHIGNIHRTLVKNGMQ